MADSTASSAAPGGFLPQSLPSPAPSTSSPTTSLGLPHPRGHSLRPGSAKEEQVRRYAEDRLLHISRRYVKKYSISSPDDDVVGYKSLSELCKDLDSLINILWLSGTPSLQVPYFLNISNEFLTWMTSFPPSPNATFVTLRKLDHCFASLLAGEDIETKEVLPGFERGLRSGLSRTDMVRCKSVVEQTRVLVVDVMSREPEDEDMDEEETDGNVTESGAATDSNMSSSNWEDDDDPFEMDVARVYENTIVALGKALGDGGAMGDIAKTAEAAPS
ncbi:uncharacterized protein E0L32_010290 [Thyridium curvatum]|uniref:Meiotic recombination protein DMC1 n=1 Tax=Thyridium curvatum TaxID=1093900 RepID=A0A507AV31_9PEZI|nr:uncharacterized protein E0L32_010290 [Thyridium curvatum]TPX08090.1 hypothetical protein E0L32_010290 [Thyridium curvatum]